MLSLRWTEHAAAQLEAIIDYIGLASPVYAEQVVTRILKRLDQAAEHPESGRIVPELEDPEIRELIEWPYRLIYRTASDAIEVISVLHGRQQWHEIE